MTTMQPVKVLSRYSVFFSFHLLNNLLVSFFVRVLFSLSFSLFSSQLLKFIFFYYSVVSFFVINFIVFMLLFLFFVNL